MPNILLFLSQFILEYRKEFNRLIGWVEMWKEVAY